MGDRIVALVVEDDEDLRDALLETLEEEGVSVVLAHDGQDALDRLEAGLRPSVVLLDLLMPGVDGIEFRKRQLASEFARIPVVALTGDRVRPPELAQLGVTAILMKPVRLEDLIRVLRAVVLTASAERDSDGH